MTKPSVEPIVATSGLSEERGLAVQPALILTDRMQSALGILHQGSRRIGIYSPFGISSMTADHGTMGFKGALLEPTGLYILGNGHRAYAPSLMRFVSPDALSPFELGGVNAYAFCQNDPVNWSDPTGRFPWQGLPGIAVGAAGVAGSAMSGGALAPLLAVMEGSALALQYAAWETRGRDESLASKLAYASLAVGATAGAIAASEFFYRFGNKLAARYRSGLSGRGASAAGARYSKPTAVVKPNSHLGAEGRQSQATTSTAGLSAPERSAFPTRVFPHGAPTASVVGIPRGASHPAAAIARGLPSSPRRIESIIEGARLNLRMAP